MNTASSDLCKELYELSGWEADNAWYYYEVGGTKLESVIGNMHKPGDGYMEMYAYTLGYLLRKLPPYCELHRAIYMDRWVITTDGELHKVIEMTADTPEDAACRLAIELFKQGVLK